MLGVVDKAELGTLLRTWRARLQPDQVGVPAGTRRRTPGLRREDVAGPAGISVDYLSRLEQGRGPQPSTAVLSALARTLRLTDDERDHLFQLSGSAPPLPTMVPTSVRPSVLRLLDRFQDLPALVLDAKSTLLYWNALAAALLGDFSHLPPMQRNVCWMRFLGSSGRVVQNEQEGDEIDQQMVSELRVAAGKYPDDPELEDLIATLRTGSARFEALWQQRLPGRLRSTNKRIEHPELGVLDFDCDTLLIPETDQRVVIYSAAPGTREAEALALLRVIGTQTMAAERA